MRPVKADAGIGDGCMGVDVARKEGTYAARGAVIQRRFFFDLVGI